MRTVGMQANWPRRRRTRIGLYLMVLGALFAAALADASHAHAAPVGETSAVFSGSAGDADQYAMWEDVIILAPSVSASQAGGFGQRVCAALDQGVGEGMIINAGVTQYGVNPSAAQYLVRAAEWHYCPEYY